MTCPGVFRSVHAVAKSHDAVAVIQQVAGVFGGVFRVADFQGHLHDLFSGSTMGRTLEGADAGDDAGVEV